MVVLVNELVTRQRERQVMPMRLGGIVVEHSQSFACSPERLWETVLSAQPWTSSSDLHPQELERNQKLMLLKLQLSKQNGEWSQSEVMLRVDAGAPANSRLSMTCLVHVVGDKDRAIKQFKEMLGEWNKRISAQLGP